jgi:pimeloyl-ACP methyl ester carboxylesterase
VTKVLPLLTSTEPGHPSFHVVAPSLPGYGWSEAPSKWGFGSSQYAEMRTLIYLNNPEPFHIHRFKSFLTR